MITLVIGGSCSGKSEYAESCIRDVMEEKYYLATMVVSDEESRRRVQRHKERREGASFQTVECPVDLAVQAEKFPCNSVVLLECLGNLAANEFFRFYTPDHWDGRTQAQNAKKRILDGIQILAGRCSELVIVSNEVNCAGFDYEGDTFLYQKLMGDLNQALCAVSDNVVEMIYGCPMIRKQGE